MKIYLVDDVQGKHETLHLVLERIQSLAGDASPPLDLGFKYEELLVNWGIDYPPAVLKSALDDENSLFLIDLSMPRTARRADRLLDEFATCQFYKEVSGAFARLPSKLRRDDYKLAMMLLLLCDRLGRRCLIVSNLAPYLDVKKASEWFELPRNITIPETPEDRVPEEMDEIARLLFREIQSRDPLDTLTRETSAWFAERDYVSPARSFRVKFPATEFPATSRKIEEELEIHRTSVQRVFPWFPNRWWESIEKASAVHESLKTLCGSSARWMGGELDLSLGGAYLLLLYAIKREFLDLDLSSSGLLADDCCCFFRTHGRMRIPIAFLPPQVQEDSERTLRSLFDFFSHVIHLKDSNPPRCAVKAIDFPGSGEKSFECRLDWTSSQRSEMGKCLAQSIRDANSGSAVLPIPEAKTTGGLLRFVLSSQVRTEGFGPIGTISLDDLGRFRVGAQL